MCTSVVLSGLGQPGALCYSRQIVLDPRVLHLLLWVLQEILESSGSDPAALLPVLSSKKAAALGSVVLIK